MVSLMENELFFGLLGIFWVYVILKLMSSKKPKEDILHNVINNDEFKVKGQWEK